VKYLDIEEPNK